MTILNLFWFQQATTAQPLEELAPLTHRGRKRRVPPTKPDLMGMVPEVVLVTDLKGGASEEPLLEAELLEGWVPPEGMTQV